MLLVSGVTLAWNAVRRSARLQRITVMAALGWAALALGWVATLPVSARWNEAWRAVVLDDAGCRTSSQLPPGMEDARHVVCAARAERAGDRAAVARHLAAVRHAADYGIDEPALAAAVQRASATQPWWATANARNP